MSEPDQPPRANPEPPADRTPPADATTPIATPATGTPAGAAPADSPAPAAQPTAAATEQASPPPDHHPSTPGKRAVVGRVVRHRATQLVAVGLLGLVLGGGIVALADRDHHPRYGVGSERPGHSRFDERGDRGERGGPGDRGERGPDRWPGRDFER